MERTLFNNNRSKKISPSPGLNITFIFLVIMLLAPLPAATQEWRKVSDTGTRPPVRELHRMAYDSARKVAVLFGGWTGYFKEMDDTWERNSTTWVQRIVATKPKKRLSHCMAYDSDRAVTVVFGGQPDSGGILNDTWEWNGASWTMRNLNNNPGARYGGMAAYDSKRGVVVLFGGYSGNKSLNDTWEYDGNDWTEKFPANPPLARKDHSMVYDSFRKKVVMFGANVYDGTTFDHDTNTYEYDGNDWTKLSIPGPPGRSRFDMAYDRYRKKVVLFGGEAGTDNLSDIWEYDGTAWMKINATGPSARYRHFMVYDPVRKKVVLFGGHDSTGYLGDTWEYGFYFDLKAKFIKASKTNVKIGKRLKLVARGKNVSKENSLPTTVYFYLSADRKLDDGDALLGGKALPAIAGKKSKKVSARYQIPVVIAPGLYYAIVRIDGEDYNIFNSVRAGKNAISVYQ